jgi:hypothetical protein
VLNTPERRLLIGDAALAAAIRFCDATQQPQPHEPRQLSH